MLLVSRLVPGLLDELESHINSANSSLVAQLKILEASEKTWSTRESERLSTFGTNSIIIIKIFSS